MTFAEFQNYYCTKWRKPNPLPWQTAMEALCYYITTDIPANTSATLEFGTTNSVELTGDGTPENPFVFKFVLSTSDVVNRGLTPTKLRSMIEGEAKNIYVEQTNNGIKIALDDALKSRLDKMFGDLPVVGVSLGEPYVPILDANANRKIAKLGDGLSYENDTLKVTGGTGGGGTQFYKHVVVTASGATITVITTRKTAYAVGAFLGQAVAGDVTAVRASISSSGGALFIGPIVEKSSTCGIIYRDSDALPAKINYRDFTAEGPISSDTVTPL